MNAPHRKVAAGAFGGLAAATAIGGIAFACTAVPSVRITEPGTTDSVPVVRPGQDVDVRVTTFTPGDPVILTWDTPATATAPHAVAPIPTAAPLVGPSFVVTVKIPATAQPTIGNNPSYVIATQRDADGQIATNSAAVVYIAGGTNAPVATPTFTPTPTPSPSPAPSVTPTPAPAPNTATPAPAATAIPTAPRAGSATAPAAAPQAAPATATAPATGTATATPAAAPAGTQASPLVIGAPVAQPLAPTSDLWSGLSADTTASLLDTAPVQDSNSGLPVGAALLGSGVVALAGVALVSTRRKLAVSRIVRR